MKRRNSHVGKSKTLCINTTRANRKKEDVQEEKGQDQTTTKEKERQTERSEKITCHEKSPQEIQVTKPAGRVSGSASPKGQRL